MKHLVSFAAALAALLLVACAESASVESAAGAKLTLVKPAAVTLRRGGMAKADIRIQRKDLPGEVTISFRNLPKGVDVVDADNKLVGDGGNYTLRADDGADLVEKFSAIVTASAGPGGVSVSEPIDVSVLPKD
jgi:hypothetical protein